VSDGVKMILVALLMICSFMVGVSVTAAMMLPEGPGVDQHFPDFWNAECR
jgi:hypothetical protein